MIPLSSAISGGLTWSKIPYSRDHALTANGEVVGALRRPSVWSSNFDAETQDGRWTFRRGGFLGTGSEIVDTSSQQHIAAFKSAWGGRGTLTFADGQTFHLECKGWWRPIWTVADESGQPLLHLHTREKAVDLPAGSAVLGSRLSLLMMFVWYRVLQAEEEAASAAAVAVITAS